ncbi:MAG TPA: RNA/single-stranded DNA exonuclease [Clostridiales bacterium]|nr:RNA/single-stranded DNA exonuclease [Clostridiales bacterium]
MKKKQLWFFLLNAILLMLISAISVSITYRYNFYAFIFLLIPLAILSVAFLLQTFVAKNNIYKFVSKLDHRINQTASDALYLYPAASVIINDEGTIVWYNKFFFEKITSGKDVFGMTISEVISVDINLLLSDTPSVVSYKNRAYEVIAKKTQRDDNPLYMLSFTDITENVLLRDKYEMSRPSVLLIMIDNYDDLLLNAKESEKAHVSVSIERLLEDFMSSTTGVLRKLSKDRFIAVIEEKHLQIIINDRFKILDEARTIIVGERTNLTLSIGVGHGAETLAESEVLAKQSLDMALGRGGDQAVIKIESGFKFFGGVSKGVEKKSRSKIRIIATAMKELIQSSEKVFIMGHAFGDLDSIGSSIGLAGAIHALGSEAYVVCDPVKNLSKPLIEKFKQAEGDNIFMNIPQALSSFTENSLLIIVDTHNKDFVESKELYEMAKHIVIIDHHRKTVNFIDNAVIFHHEPYASSAAEMVTEIIHYFFDTSKISSAYAEALLAGIALDTKNFVMKTGVRTFEAAASLRKLGADTISVKKLFSSSIESYQCRSNLVANAEIHNNCAIAISDLNSEEIRFIAPQAADELLGIANVDASFVIFKSNGSINISARSLGNINVQVIMEKLGGGGHQTMAATQLVDVDTGRAKKMLISAINDK